MFNLSQIAEAVLLKHCHYQTVPVAPTAITGPASVCSYVGSATNAVYSITAVAGAASYNWTVPAGATIVSGAGTTSINVAIVQVLFQECWCTINIRLWKQRDKKHLLLLKLFPVAPTAITGPANVCSYVGTATNATYSITAVAGATSYNWTVPSGATLISGQGTTSIDVNYSGSFVSGNVSVQSVSGCGNSVAKALAITKTIPLMPGSISGTTNVCAYTGTATNLVYTITAVAGADSYNWTVPTGSTLISGQGTTSITIKFYKQFCFG